MILISQTKEIIFTCVYRSLISLKLCQFQYVSHDLYLKLNVCLCMRGTKIILKQFYKVRAMRVCGQRKF